MFDANVDGREGQRIGRSRARETSLLIAESTTRMRERGAPSDAHRRSRNVRPFEQGRRMHDRRFARLQNENALAV